jgi:hypothetical protein
VARPFIAGARFFGDNSISLYLTQGGSVRISSALTNCQFTDEVGVRKKKPLKQAINIVSARRRATCYKPGQGGWLKQAAGVTPGLENITIFPKISKYQKYHDIFDILIYIGYFRYL